MARPRFVSVTRTGNENDIIEPFVRHHAALFDLMLVIDDDSSDGTWTILEQLRDEGLPLLLFRAAEVDWPQIDLVSRLMHLAFDEHGADWVAPLDADEFIEPRDGTALGDILPATIDRVAQLRWSNFAWHRSLDEREKNPVVRMRMRMPPRTDSYKIIVPRAALCGDAKAKLASGNHDLMRHGSYADLAYFREKIALCHYPIRSIQQFISKSVINYLRYKALPNGPATAGFQYDRPFDLTKSSIESYLSEIVAEMERSSPAYALQAGGKMIGVPAERPLAYRGGPLLYSIYPTSALTNIVNLAERFAHRIAELEEGLGLPSGP